MHNIEYKLKTKDQHKGRFSLEKRINYWGLSSTSRYQTPWEDIEYFTPKEIDVFVDLVNEETTKSEIEEKIRLKGIKIKNLEELLASKLTQEYKELEQLKRELHG